MRFLPPDEPVELYKTVFDKDLLGRGKVSKELSSVVDRIEDPLVIALDGRWGTGKSYFLKRWVGAHRLQNGGSANTVYFDAFANDYLSDPLIALVSALSDRIPKEEKRKLERLKKVAYKFIKPAARIGLALASYGATEALSGLGDVVAGAAKDEATKAVNDFWKHEKGRHAAMLEFHSAIEMLTKSPSPDEPTPLVIVIDELDRCRPDYALEVLEVIKHFFAVPRVHFVLGVNLTALENSVKVRYGLEIDASAYLQKFLSFTMSLPDEIGGHSPATVVAKYAAHVGEQMDIPPVLLEDICIQLGILERFNHISIRDVGKVLSAAALLPDDARGDTTLGMRIATVTLIITKVIRPDLFSKLLKASMRHEELMLYFDPTNDFIEQVLHDGEVNENFDNNTWNTFFVWKYICSGGVLENKEHSNEVARYFDHHRRRPRGIKKIPSVIHNEWLKVFRLS